MAFTINEQPTSLAYSRSPVLYQVYDTNTVTYSDYRYSMKVYIWEGAIASIPATASFELLRYPNASGSAYFNIQQLCDEYFTSQNPTIADQFHDDMIYNLYAVFGNYYDDGEGYNYHEEELSNVVQFVHGYTGYPNGINYTNPGNTGQSYPTAYAQRVSDDGGEVESIGCIPDELSPLTGGEFMTDIPRNMILPENQRYTMSLYYKKTTSKVQDVIVWDDNSNTYTFDLSVIVTASDSSEKFVLTLDVGSDKFNDYALSPTRYWYVQGFDDKGLEVTQKYTFETTCVSKWGYTQLQFINKYGVWDYIPCWGKASEELMATRKRFHRDTLTVGQATIGYNVYDAPKRDYNIKGDIGLKINTGWLHEDYAEVLSQMYLSDFIVDQSTLLPYNVKGNMLPILNFTNDKLLNWTIDMEEAYKTINSVG